MKKILLGLIAAAILGVFVVLALFNPSVAQTEIRKTIPNEQFFSKKAP